MTEQAAAAAAAEITLEVELPTGAYKSSCVICGWSGKRRRERLAHPLMYSCGLIMLAGAVVTLPGLSKGEGGLGIRSALAEVRGVDYVDYMHVEGCGTTIPSRVRAC